MNGASNCCNYLILPRRALIICSGIAEKMQNVASVKENTGVHHCHHDVDE